LGIGTTNDSVTRNRIRDEEKMNEHLFGTCVMHAMRCASHNLEELSSV